MFLVKPLSLKNFFSFSKEKGGSYQVYFMDTVIVEGNPKIPMQRLNRKRHTGLKERHFPLLRLLSSSSASDNCIRISRSPLKSSLSNHSPNYKLQKITYKITSRISRLYSVIRIHPLMHSNNHGMQQATIALLLCPSAYATKSNMTNWHELKNKQQQSPYLKLLGLHT